MAEELSSAEQERDALREALEYACDWFDDDACRHFSEPSWYSEARALLAGAVQEDSSYASD